MNFKARYLHEIGTVLTSFVDLIKDIYNLHFK